MPKDPQKKKNTFLEKLSIDEVSFVDRGSNPGADILLFKRDGGMDKDEKVSFVKKLIQFVGLSKQEIVDISKLEEDDMTDVEKKLAETVTKVEELTKGIELANSITKLSGDIAKASDADSLDSIEVEIGKLDKDDARVSDLTKSVKDAREGLKKTADNTVVEEFGKKLPESLKKVFTAMDADGKAEFIKGYSAPEDNAASAIVTKALEELEKSNKANVAKLEKMEKDADIQKMVEGDFAGLANAQEVAESVYTLQKSDPAAAEVMTKNFKAMKEQLKKSNLFKVLGQDGEGSSAEDKLEKLAKSRAEKDSITHAAAYAKVLTENPDLYQETLDQKEA